MPAASCFDSFAAFSLISLRSSGSSASLFTVSISTLPVSSLSSIILPAFAFCTTNSGDDRIYDFNSSDYTGDYTAQQPETTMPLQSGVDEMAQGFSFTPTLEVVNARFVDANQNGQIERGELCKIIFEVMNRGPRTVYDIQPTVVEATGNKHIFVSPNMHVEQIQPGKGIRYTAMVKADGRLKNGSAKFCVSVIQGNTHISKVTEFNIPTVK